MVPGLRDEFRHHAARRDFIWDERSPYRRVLLQGPGARAAGGGGDRSARQGRGAVHQGLARRVNLSSTSPCKGEVARLRAGGGRRRCAIDPTSDRFAVRPSPERGGIRKKRTLRN